MKVQLLELIETLVHQRKMLVLISLKHKILHYNDHNSYLFVDQKEIFKLKDENIRKYI